MKKTVPITPILLLLAAVCTFTAGKAQTKNPAPDVRILPSGTIEFATADGKTETAFRPEFTVLYRADDPGLGQNRFTGLSYTLPFWKSRDNREPQNRDYYKSAEAIAVNAVKSVKKGDIFTLLFPEHPLFALEADIKIPAGGFPEILFRFFPKKEGYYSVGYTGAMTYPPDRLEELWQPYIWQERRFPDQCYLTVDNASPLPATTVTFGGITSGVVVNPSFIPYRMPNFSRVKYGLLVRNSKGDAQPQLFSPVLGTPASKMNPGDSYTFGFHVFSIRGRWVEAYKYLAYQLFGFGDYRRNATCSLNETIENMVQFAMNDFYSGWNEELKAFDYTTDVKHTVKLVSSLHPLSLAVITDNEEIYQRRAKPMIEYLMSREKYLFSSVKGVTGQSPSHAMNGPAAEVSELGALFAFSRQRTPVFSRYAVGLLDKPRALNLQLISEADSWQNLLAVYRVTGEQRYLDRAVVKAREYVRNRIDTSQRDFKDVSLNDVLGGQFWTDFTPKWMDLIELFETTGDRLFLQAALQGAYRYAGYVWMQPKIPQGAVPIHESGQLPMGDRHNKANPKPILVAPQKVPAWRVSPIGLTPESSYTYSQNQGMFMTCYAAWMLRLAHYTGDVFLKDIARSAVVGRYANFPGYDINDEFTNFYERPDYPLRNWTELTYNQIYYNHVWPHIALLTDFLVTEAMYRSGAKISFPSQYAQGYAYMQSKVYGSEEGVFFSDRNVRLWMPAKLLRSDHIQVNYVSGYGNGNLYLALMNQSDESIEPVVSLQPDLVPVDEGKIYKVRMWDKEGKLTFGSMQDARLKTSIPPKGLVAVAVEGLEVLPKFQKKFFSREAVAWNSKSHLQGTTPFGKATGMIISMGAGLVHAYVWLEADESVLQKAVLYYKMDQEWRSMEDVQFPFEYSIPLDDSSEVIQFRLEGMTPEGRPVKSEVFTLSR